MQWKVLGSSSQQAVTVQPGLVDIADATSGPNQLKQDREPVCVDQSGQTLEDLVPRASATLGPVSAF